MKTSITSLSFLIVLLLTFCTPQNVQSQEGRLLKLYDGLDLIEPYSSLSKYEELISDIESEDQNVVLGIIADEYDGLDMIFDTEGISKLDFETSRTLDAYLVYEFWEEYIRKAYHPTEEELLEVLQSKNGSPFEIESDWVECARILVRNDSDDAEAIAEHLYSRIKSGENFQDVARDYYRTVGLDYDGSLGLMEKDSGVRPQFFQHFWQRESVETFGPIKDKNGWLIGKLIDKGKAGYRPVDQIENRLLNEYFAVLISEKRREILDQFYSESKIGTFVDLESWPDDLLPPTPDTKLFKIDGETILWSDVKSLTPMIWGDESNPDFPPIITEKALFRAALNRSNIADQLRQSTHYQELRRILNVEARIVAQLDHEQSNLDLSEEVLHEFYEQSQQQKHFEPPQVKVLGAMVNRSMESRSMRARREADLKLWNGISEIYEHVKTFETPEEAWWKEYAVMDELTVYQNANEWIPVDQIHYFLGPHALELEPGQDSGLLISDRNYGFLFLLARKNGDKIPFTDLEKQIENDYLMQWRENRRKELLSLNKTSVKE